VLNEFTGTGLHHRHGHLSLPGPKEGGARRSPGILIIHRLIGSNIDDQAAEESSRDTAARSLFDALCRRLFELSQHLFLINI